MSERRLTDAELAAALRVVAPQSAPSGSSDRLAVALRAMGQRRSLPFPIAPLVDADPAARRWALLAAAAILLAAALAGAIAVGALRLWPSPRQDLSLVPPSFTTTSAPQDLALDPPEDLQAYMVSVTQDSPVLRPMAFTVVDNQHQNWSGEVLAEPSLARVYMDASGAVRVERFASVDATEPSGYSIFTADRHVELAAQGSEAVWVEEIGPTEPRFRIFDETAAYTGVADRGCEMSELDPSAGWEYVGLEEILGRPVHHVRCDGDFWVDVETRLVMRSSHTEETAHTIEVTSLELAPQPAALFDPTRPDGLRTVTVDEQHDYEVREYEARTCAADPVCSAPLVPIVSPAPASGAPPPRNLVKLVARARAAREAAPPLHLTVNRWRPQGGFAGQDQLDYMGLDRFRVDVGSDPVAGSPRHTVIAIGGGEGYESRSADDGSVSWSHGQGPSRSFDVAFWLYDMLIDLPDECSGGWHHLGVDTVGTFTADHLECDGTEYWIDRETDLVVRRQSGGQPDGQQEIDVREVAELTFGATPDERFQLPDGAVIEPDPTPDPNFIPTEPPHPAPG